MLTFALTFGLVLAFVILLVFVSRSTRKSGGGMSTLMLGATDGLMNEEKKRAAETIVKLESGQKLDEEGSEGEKD